MTDEWTTRLEWIRDGLKWIVGIAAGLLTISATYFYDRFAQAPRLAAALWLAWGLLVVAAFAGILATLATWKNLGRTGGLGPFLTWLYTIAMWSFTAGFAVLAVVLLVNVARSHRPGEVVGLFAARDTLPPFAPASAVAADPRFDVAACAIRRQLAEAGSLAALVVGRADRRELTPGAQARHASNLELAQRRAERVRELLSDESLCDARPIRRVIALTSGWRQAPPAGASGAEADALLAGDRRVEVYGFQVRVP